VNFPAVRYLFIFPVSNPFLPLLLAVEAESKASVHVLGAEKGADGLALAVGADGAGALAPATGADGSGALALATGADGAGALAMVAGADGAGADGAGAGADGANEVQPSSTALVPWSDRKIAVSE
jgi:hypothetical protein